MIEPISAGEGRNPRFSEREMPLVMRGKDVVIAKCNEYANVLNLNGDKWKLDGIENVTIR